ncbi:MAG: hypothetical protein NT069_28935 [Planctomycetota bacterium]|nr:hypothetical protein [Planctomycetota bacterium]
MKPTATQRTTPRYNPTRNRRRIVWSVMSLAIVLIAISEARKPGNWKWLAPDPTSSPTAREGKARPALAEKDDLEPDQIRIVTPRNSSQLATRDRQPADLDLRISGDFLDAVEDSRVGVRAAENPAYFAMLAKSREIPVDRFESAARIDLTYATLMNDPAEHRGEIVWVEGELRRFGPIPAGPNDEGFDELYEGWLFTDEAGRTNPYRIVCVSAPADFTEGNEIRERVRIPAYFFKRLNYATAHGQHAAPMFIGREFQKVVRSGSKEVSDRMASLMVPAVVLLVCTFGVLLLVTRQWTARRVPLHRHVSGAADSPLELGGDPPADPREFLARLERESVDENPPPV